MPDPSAETVPLKILIADDHALVRGGLSALIRTLLPDIAIRECNSFEHVTRTLSEENDFDLLLIDLMMPGMQSVESIQFLCSNWPDVPIVIVSVKEDMHLIRQALRAGATGYIPKSSSPNVTLNAVRLVLSGGIYIPPDALELRGFADDESDRKPVLKAVAEENQGADAGLTPRQVDVLDLIAEGKSNQEIGDELGLTAGTVKMHLTRIYKSLGAKSRTDALAKYNRLRRSKEN